MFDYINFDFANYDYLYHETDIDNAINILGEGLYVTGIDILNVKNIMRIFVMPFSLLVIGSFIFTGLKYSASIYSKYIEKEKLSKELIELLFISLTSSLNNWARTKSLPSY